VRDRCGELLAHPRDRPGDHRLWNRLLKQRDLPMTCVEKPAAEPANNRAERALRPAVIAHKVSRGNRTEAGRQTWEVLASLAATCAERGQDFVTHVTSRLSLTPQQG